MASKTADAAASGAATTEKKKTARRTPSMFRGVLDSMIEEKKMKVELGLEEGESDLTKIVRDKKTGDVYGVTVKLLRKGNGDKEKDKDK